MPKKKVEEPKKVKTKSTKTVKAGSKLQKIANALQEIPELQDVPVTVVPKGRRAKKPFVLGQVVQFEDEPWSPSLGEKFLLNDEVVAVTSFDPLEAMVYRREDGVQTSNPYPITSLVGAQPLSKQEEYERIF